MSPVAGVPRTIPLRYPLVLGTLTALFALRVVGQALVAFFDVSFLPPMQRWYSGLVPYVVLLPVQLGMIVVMLKVVRDFARGAGWFMELRPRTGTILMWFSYLYAFGMVVRYAVTMVRQPELRWFTGTIPIWFHLVLAAFIYTLGHYHVRHAPARRAPTQP
jgi:hypothetical protein